MLCRCCYDTPFEESASLTLTPSYTGNLDPFLAAQANENKKILRKNSLETIFNISYSYDLSPKFMFHLFRIANWQDSPLETRFLQLPLCGSQPVQQPLFLRRGPPHRIQRLEGSIGMSFSEEVTVAIMPRSTAGSIKFEPSNRHLQIYPSRQDEGQPSFRVQPPIGYPVKINTY